MSNWLTYESKRFAAVDINHIYGQHGVGIYRLIAKLSFIWDERTQEDAITVDRMAVDLYIRGTHPKENYVGRLEHREYHFPAILKTKTYNPEDISFVIDLDSKRIEAMEELRQGRNLDLSFEIEGIAYKNKDNLQRINTSIFYRMNQSEWIEILENMNYRKTLLIKIPLLEDKTWPEASAINQHLLAAQQHMLHGNYREAVGACRDVLENLSAALGDDKDIILDTTTVREYFKESRNMDKTERLRQIRRALKFYTHPARHADEVASKYNWDHVDARSVIAMTATTIQMVNNAK